MVDDGNKGIFKYPYKCKQNRIAKNFWRFFAQISIFLLSKSNLVIYPV
jgi:hypothetical protein